MLRTLVLVTAATALRISEVLTLQWGDIDGEN
jgi:integrase